MFGAGAVGGHIAGRLARGGADVSVVARGPHLAAMQANGLVVHAPDGTIEARVRASADPADLGVQDAVLVSVKAPALPAIATALRPLLGPDTSVAFLMNGIPWWYFHREGGPHDGRRLPRIDPGDAIWNAVGPERAIGGVVYSGCTVTSPGVIEVDNAMAGWCWASRTVSSRPGCRGWRPRSRRAGCAARSTRASATGYGRSWC